MVTFDTSRMDAIYGKGKVLILISNILQGHISSLKFTRHYTVRLMLMQFIFRWMSSLSLEIRNEHYFKTHIGDKKQEGGAIYF